MYRQKIKLIVLMFFFCLASVFSVQSSSAEIIKLKSGQEIKAPIITRTDENIKVDMGIGIVITYYMDDIHKILADSKSSAEFEEYQLFLSQQLDHMKRVQNMYRTNDSTNSSASAAVVKTYTQNVDRQIEDIETVVHNLNQNYPSEIQKLKSSIGLLLSNQIQNTGRFFEVLAKLASSKFMVENVLSSKIVLMIVVSWIVACYPMMLLAKKRQERFYWMAWVPVLHIYLLTRLTQKSMWWLVYLLIPMVFVVVPFIVPVQFYKWWFFGGLFISVINFIVVPALLWSKLAEEMNHPAWWGALSIIPIANIMMIHKLNLTFVPPVSKRERYLNRIAPHLVSRN